MPQRPSLKKTPPPEESDEPRFRGVFDHALSIMAVLSPEGRMIEANQAALHFHHLNRTDLVGRTLWQAPWFRGNAAAARHAKAAVAAASAGRIVHSELALIGPTGQEHFLDFSLTP